MGLFKATFKLVETVIVVLVLAVILAWVTRDDEKPVAAEPANQAPPPILQNAPSSGGRDDAAPL